MSEGMPSQVRRGHLRAVPGVLFGPSSSGNPVAKVYGEEVSPVHRVNRNSRIPDRARRLIVTLGAMSACSRAILCLVFVPHRECVCVCSCLYVCRGTARRSEAVESKHSIRERPANDSAADRGNMSLGVYSSWPLPRVLVETWVLSWFRRCTRHEDCLSFAAPTLTPASRPVGARRAVCFAYTVVFRQSSRASTI